MTNIKLELNDLTAFITVLNVLFIILGYAWAPILGIINCIIIISTNAKKDTHINFYITQIAIVILNTYFLVG